MTEVNETALREAVEALHGCQATFQATQLVKEEFEGEVAWEGKVHIFDITGHPSATICYAWSSPIEGSDNRKFYAVLNIPPVDSPEKAVRAAIISDHRSQ